MANKKILLAEDDKFIWKAYRAGLADAGFDVVGAQNGEEAIAKIKSEKPDIILLDIVMPLKNGFEILEELKIDESIKDIPVIMLTNLGQKTDINKAKALGAVDYIVKSNFTMSDFIEKVRFYLATT